MTNRALSEALRELLDAGTRRLIVGKGLRYEAAAHVASPVELPREAQFDRVIWFARDGLRAGVAALRVVLAPSGLLVLVPELGSALARAFRGGGSKDAAARLEEACGALVLSGLSEPRVIGEGRHEFAVCATKPEQLNALDAFFEQPTP